MSKVNKATLCAEIDQFLLAQKRLMGPQPVWRPNGTLLRLDGSWAIEEDEGFSRAYLAFRLNRVSTNEPSVSLIFRSKPVCRIDIKPMNESDGNPPQARKFGLPGQVFGPHAHHWEHNREYVLEALPPDEWAIPIKEQVSPSTQSLGHILAMICSKCAIDFTGEQRDITLPAPERLI